MIDFYWCVSFHSLSRSHVISFLSAKGQYDITDVQILAETVLAIIAGSEADSFIQIRWALVLSEYLRHYRYKLKLSLDWRLFYRLLRSFHFDSSRRPEGGALTSSHSLAITKLIKRSRRFFKAGSSTEIWEEFRPHFSNTASNQALEALGFVSLFMPVHSIGYDGGKWNEWIIEWIEIWNWVPHCRWWTSMWLELFSRIVKHDVENIIHWDDINHQLMTKIHRGFEVPIGSSSGSAPMGRNLTKEVVSVFRVKGFASGLGRSAAKLLVYLVGHNESKVIDGIKRINGFLENYYHPSNGGSWSSTLAAYLQNFGMYLRKKLSRDSISEELLQPLVKSLARLASKAQFSKNGSVSAAGIYTMSVLAQIGVEEIAPLIIDRFYEALETHTAMHQLTSAISSLSRAARPILEKAASFTIRESDGGNESMQIDVPIWIYVFNDALVMTLPGIDANDPSKTLAVLELYASVLSNCCMLDDSNDSVVRPTIGWQQWSEEFFDRIFNLITNLNAPGPSSSGLDDSHASSDEACTFLWNSKSFYSPLMGLLLARMPQEMRTRAVERIASFLLTNSMLGVVPEMGLLAQACALLDPETTSRALVAPLCDALEKTLERAVPNGVGVTNMSRMLEDTLEYQISILRHSLQSRNDDVDIVSNFLPRVTSIIQLTLKSTSLNGVACASGLLERTMRSLTHQRPLETYSPMKTDGKSGIDEWISRKQMTTTQSVAWHVPSTHHTKAARYLIQEVLVPNLKLMEEFKKVSDAKSDEVKRRIRSILWAIDGCMCAVTNDWNPESLSISSASRDKIIDEQILERLALALPKFLTVIDPDDNETLHTFIRLVSITLLPSTSLFEGFISRASEWKASAKVMSQILPDSFHTRRPRWVHVERVRVFHVYRMSQVMFKCALPGAPHGLPPKDSYSSLVDVLFQLSLHPYIPLRKYAQICVEACNKFYPTIVPMQLTKNLGVLQNLVEGSNADVESVIVRAKSTEMRSVIEGSICGATSMLCGRSMTRYIMRDGNSFSELIMALCRLSKFDSMDSVRIQSSLQNLFITICMRFSTIGFTKLHSKQLVDDLLSFWKEFGSNMHWRFAVLLNSFIVLSLHDIGTHSRSALVLHFIDMLQNPSPVIRPLALTALSLLFRKQFQNYEDDALKNLKIELCSSTTRWNGILDSLSYCHGNRDSVGRGSGDSDQNIVKFLVSIFSLSRDWPRSKLVSSAISRGSFVLLYARTMKRLFRWCGSDVVPQIQLKLEEMIKSREKPNQSAAAEIFGGLIRSRVVTTSPSGGQWQNWIEAASRRALRDCPVQCISEWSASLRYCVKGPDSMLEGARGRLVELLFEPVTESESSNQQMRRLAHFNDCLAELMDSDSKDGVESFKSRLISALKALNAHAARQVREQAGRCAAQVGGLYSHPVLASSVDVNLGRCAPQAESFITSFTSQAKHALGIVLAEKDDAITATDEITVDDDRMTSDDVDRMDDSSNYPTWDKDRSTACLETILYFVVASVRNGDSISLSSTLNSLLPIVVRIQETPNCDFSLLAKTALAYMKHAYVPAADLPHVIDGLLDASREVSSWHTRAAALSFMQVLWYRHFFLLNNGSTSVSLEITSVHPLQTPSESAASGQVMSLTPLDISSKILTAIIGMLNDEQLEVRELAAATLAGFFKGMDDHLADSLRAKFMEEALAVFNEAKQYRKKLRSQLRKNSRTSSPTSDDEKEYKANLLLRSHAAALSLGACILSSPYEMPSWLPRCICLFAEFATEPSPVRDCVSKTLSDFWRTHTDNWHNEKMSFTVEQIDILTSSRNAPGYYC